MSKDSFQILADELTLIRHDIERLQRTSLNKDEAKALHKIVTEKADDMLEMGPLVERTVESKLNVFLGMLGNDAVRAAEDAVIKSHAESIKAAHRLSVAAGEARKEAWRYFGGFWVWIVSVGALGAVLGVLATVAIQGRGDAEAFGVFPGLYCEKAGGTKVTSSAGTRYCAFELGLTGK